MRVTTIIDIIIVAVPVAGLAFGAVRWGREQRPGFADTRRERAGERWAIR